jgi:uncharacterized protein (DUF1330 family)
MGTASFNGLLIICRAHLPQLTQPIGCHNIATRKLLHGEGIIAGGAARSTGSAEEDKMNENPVSGRDRGNISQRPVAYVISAIEGIADEATARRYAELAGPAIERFGGRFIVSNAEPVVVEGESPSARLSMVQFPTIEDAESWYDSPENAEARAITPAAFKGRTLMFVQGVKAEQA